MMDVDAILARVWSSGPSVLAVILGAWLTAGVLLQWQPGAEYGLAVFLLLAALAHLIGRRLPRRKGRQDV